MMMMTTMTDDACILHVSIYTDHRFVLVF